MPIGGQDCLPIDILRRQKVLLLSGSIRFLTGIGGNPKIQSEKQVMVVLFKVEATQCMHSQIVFLDFNLIF